jgi:hypothetical protein
MPCSSASLEVKIDRDNGNGLDYESPFSVNVLPGGRLGLSPGIFYDIRWISGSTSRPQPTPSRNRPTSTSTPSWIVAGYRRHGSAGRSCPDCKLQPLFSRQQPAIFPQFSSVCLRQGASTGGSNRRLQLGLQQPSPPPATTADGSVKKSGGPALQTLPSLGSSSFTGPFTGPFRAGLRDQIPHPS